MSCLETLICTPIYSHVRNIVGLSSILFIISKLKQNNYRKDLQFSTITHLDFCSWNLVAIVLYLISLKRSALSRPIHTYLARLAKQYFIFLVVFHVQVIFFIWKTHPSFYFAYWKCFATLALWLLYEVVLRIFLAHYCHNVQAF